MNKETTVYISLGSNLGDSINLLNIAIEQIKEKIGSVITKSSYYKTEPWGFVAENNFVNAMIAVKTKLQPEEVLQQLLDIENQMGRTRNKEGVYESRRIDLDIIAIDNLVLKTKRLVVPHPKMRERSFVLVPFLEINPNWRNPLLDKSLEELLNLRDDVDKVKRLGE